MKKYMKIDNFTDDCTRRAGLILDHLWNEPTGLRKHQCLGEVMFRAKIAGNKFIDPFIMVLT